MGFAKYTEDDLSRYHQATVVREREHVRFKSIADQQQRSVQITKQRMKRMSEQKTPNRMKDFTLVQARPLPVIVLADASGSMFENGKIAVLNQALKDMIQTFAAESRVRAEVQVGLITFGGACAQLHLPLAPAHQILGFPTLTASGSTPMGQAFDLARVLLEDKDKIPSRAYRPVLILVSDGLPTDAWEQPFAALQASERGKKASRFAMAIGNDADESMLQQFANDPEAPVFKAHEARDIHRFFRAVTMSVTSRTVSTNPDQLSRLNLPELPDDDALDLDF
jgi:uncharacterized protein YegL